MLRCSDHCRRPKARCRQQTATPAASRLRPVGGDDAAVRALEVLARQVVAQAPHGVVGFAQRAPAGVDEIGERGHDSQEPALSRLIHRLAAWPQGLSSGRGRAQMSARAARRTRRARRGGRASEHRGGPLEPGIDLSLGGGDLADVQTAEQVRPLLTGDRVGGLHLQQVAATPPRRDGRRDDGGQACGRAPRHRHAAQRGQHAAPVGGPVLGGLAAGRARQARGQVDGGDAQGAGLGPAARAQRRRRGRLVAGRRGSEVRAPRREGRARQRTAQAPRPLRARTAQP